MKRNKKGYQRKGIKRVKITNTEQMNTSTCGLSARLSTREQAKASSIVEP